MGDFIKRVLQKILANISDSYVKYPSAMLCNLIFALTTCLRIYWDWQVLREFDFLLESVQLACVIGAVTGLAAVTFVQSRSYLKQKFVTANVLALALSVCSFLYLFYWGREELTSGYSVVSDLAFARMLVAAFVGMLLFIILVGVPIKEPRVDKSFFMVQKAFFIAIIYGIVFWLGSAGVAAAVEALLYENMSSNVYAYLGAFALFLAFTFFVGYFPNFEEGQSEEKRVVAEQHPKFITVLFNYIMIPVVLGLSLVLLLWTGKLFMDQTYPGFNSLVCIAASYTVFGIWLHLMVADYDGKAAVIYKKTYPLVALIILAAEAVALYMQVQESGLEETEYLFSVLWVFTFSASLGLIFARQQFHIYKQILLTAALLLVVTVLPFIGYQTFPVTWQLNRLENLLESEKMLNYGRLQHAPEELSQESKKQITEMVLFLVSKHNKQLPDWLTTDVTDNVVFKEKFGFNQMRWLSPNRGNINHSNVYLTNENSFINIQGYEWAIKPEIYGSENKTWEFTDEQLTYSLHWNNQEGEGIPLISLKNGDNQLLLQEDLKEYTAKLRELYPLENSGNFTAQAIEMQIKLANEKADVYIVFERISLRKDEEKYSYTFSPQMIYVKLKS